MLEYLLLADPPKKRSSFLCSIICCLGKKRSSKHKDKDGGGGLVAVPGNDVTDNNKAKASAPVKALLPEQRPELADKKCIVIDLDETLVHSSFKVS